MAENVSAVLLAVGREVSELARHSAQLRSQRGAGQHGLSRARSQRVGDVQGEVCGHTAVCSDSIMADVWLWVIESSVIKHKHFHCSSFLYFRTI